MKTYQASHVCLTPLCLPICRSFQWTMCHRREWCCRGRVFKPSDAAQSHNFLQRAVKGVGNYFWKDTLSWCFCSRRLGTKNWIKRGTSSGRHSKLIPIIFNPIMLINAVGKLQFLSIAINKFRIFLQINCKYSYSLKSIEKFAIYVLLFSTAKTLSKSDLNWQIHLNKIFDCLSFLTYT